MVDWIRATCGWFPIIWALSSIPVAAAEVGLTTEAHAPPEGGASYVTWFMFVVVIWIVVVLANTVASSPPDHVMGFIASLGEGPIAHHLYLPCRVGGREAHLRTMSMRQAEILVGQGLRKGQWLDLEIDSLIVRAKVLRLNRLQRNGEHLVVLLLRPGSSTTKAALKALILEWTGTGDNGAGRPMFTRRAKRYVMAANRGSFHR